MSHRNTRAAGYSRGWDQNISQEHPALPRSLASILIATFAFAGCATMRIQEYPKTPVTSYSKAMTKNDLCIAIRPMTEKKELEQYFGTDLSALKIVPIHIVAENRSPSSSFVLSKDNMSLQNNRIQSSLKQGDRTGTGDTSGGEAAVLIGSVIGSPLLIFLGGKEISDAEVIKRNLVAKELQTRTVSPGKSVDGFVYFKLPEESGPGGDWYLSIQAGELGAKISHQFTFALQ